VHVTRRGQVVAIGAPTGLLRPGTYLALWQFDPDLGPAGPIVVQRLTVR
jgi:hypothetical protein